MSDQKEQASARGRAGAGKGQDGGAGLHDSAIFYHITFVCQVVTSVQSNQGVRQHGTERDQ